MFGVVLPIRQIAFRNPAFLLGYRGVVLALITVFGYMLTGMRHYGLFKLPKCRTNSEGILFAATWSACLVVSEVVLLFEWRSS